MNGNGDGDMLQTQADLADAEEAYTQKRRAILAQLNVALAQNQSQLGTMQIVDAAEAPTTP